MAGMASRFNRGPSASTTSTTSIQRLTGVKGGISYVNAMALVESREAHIRRTFDRFDLDRSGTIDMDELLVLLDDLGMLERLRTDSEEFVRDMFIKYDANFDGVLSFEEFIGLHNAALDDSLGRRQKDEKPMGTARRAYGGSTQEARKKLAAEKAAKKAAEAARIHKQNAEMKARIQAMGKGKDPKALDAEIEAQRRALAQARADAKAAEKARLDEENAALAARRKAVKSKTDDDITDDVTVLADGTVITGGGRDAAAAASKARKEAEAARIERENEEMRKLIANTVARTDDDITDDVAADGTVGAGRAEAAAASKARKEAEAAKLAEENAAMRERIRNTGAATDNDITDDVTVLADGTVITGGGRDAAAAASKARKEAEAAQLKAENDAMDAMIRNTGAATVNQLS